MSENYFSRLNGINVNGRTEKKNGLAYLSWAWAWAEVKKVFPDATYTIYENAQGWNYHTDGKTCWVKTGVTVNGIEHIEYLPVMNYSNKSIPADKVTSFDVNTAVQRSLTKACARHGLGLYLYAGEDLPEGDERPEQPKKEPDPPKKKLARKPARPEPALLQEGELAPGEAECPVCHKIQRPMKKIVDGEPKLLSGYEIIVGCGGMCLSCYRGGNHDAV